MNREASKKLESFFRALGGAPMSLLLLDYDGTLAGFRLDRFKARPWAGVSELLAKIQRQDRTRIGVITGRPAIEIPPMLGLDAPPEVWGLHGAQRLFPNGRIKLEKPSPGTRARLDTLRRQLTRDAFGGLFEDKPNAAVMHWRGRSRKQARAIASRTRTLFEPLAKLDGLRLLEFESGLELRTGRDKGGAIRAIMREVGPVPVTYLGDDLTDEAGFRAVNEAKGPHLSVLMRRAWRTTDADVWLKPPVELRSFLKRWIEAGG
ncbi:MAG: trehalose-phosphatase [Terracidiphilus sp.]